MTVASLRMEAAQTPDDPKLATLVGELSLRDPRFRTWWAAHHVTSRAIGTKHLHHHLVGDLTLDWDTLSSASDPDRVLSPDCRRRLTRVGACVVRDGARRATWLLGRPRSALRRLSCGGTMLVPDSTNGGSR